MRKKIVYIAHPISGDIEGNLKDLQRIIRKINLNEVPKDLILTDWSNIVPLAPYYADIISLDDNNPLERKRGIENDIAVIESGVFDELWLTGDKISFGMQEEVKLFVKLGKPVLNYTKRI